MCEQLVIFWMPIDADAIYVRKFNMIRNNSIFLYNNQVTNCDTKILGKVVFE